MYVTFKQSRPGEIRPSRARPVKAGPGRLVAVGMYYVYIMQHSKKELSKQVDEVSQVLERSIPIKVVLPPTKEENSRCKGRNLLSD